MPYVRGDFGVRAFDLLPLSFDHPVEADIVFEGVGTDHVIVVRRGKPYDNPTRLIHLSTDGLESYLHIDILRRNSLVDGERESVVGRIRARLCDDPSIARGRIIYNAPFPDIAAACPREGKIFGSDPGLHSREVDLRRRALHDLAESGFVETAE